MNPYKIYLFYIPKGIAYKINFKRLNRLNRLFNASLIYGKILSNRDVYSKISFNDLMKKNKFQLKDISEHYYKSIMENILYWLNENNNIADTNIIDYLVPHMSSKVIKTVSFEQIKQSITITNLSHKYNLNNLNNQSSVYSKFIIISRILNKLYPKKITLTTTFSIMEN